MKSRMSIFYSFEKVIPGKYHHTSKERAIGEMKNCFSKLFFFFSKMEIMKLLLTVLNVRI